MLKPNEDMFHQSFTEQQGEPCWSLTRTEVVVFQHVALQAAAGGELFGAAGCRAPGPQGAGILFMLLGMNVQAAAC